MTSRATAPEARERERAIAATATRQHGVVSRRQLMAKGVTRRSIDRRIEKGRLHPIHRGVYAVGHERLSVRGRWMAAVLAAGDGALRSHRSAAALWGLMATPRGPADVLAPRRRRRPGILLHGGRIAAEDRASRDLIPTTSVARTLFDLAEAVDEPRLRRAFEEADRLRLLSLEELGRVHERNPGRRALGPISRLIAAAEVAPATRSELEDRFTDLCREHDLPRPLQNATVLGFEVDVLWPGARLVAELDGYAYHRHRAAFERDRSRDAALLAAGYRVLRLTQRRLAAESAARGNGDPQDAVSA